MTAANFTGFYRGSTQALRKNSRTEA